MAKIAINLTLVLAPDEKKKQQQKIKRYYFYPTLNCFLQSALCNIDTHA